MKSHKALFALIALFFVGTYSTIGQEVKKEQENYATKKRELAKAQNSERNNMEMTPETIARKQTLHLKQLLNLDDAQSLRVHEICSSVEYEMSKIPMNVDEHTRMKLVSNLENIKNEKLKEALTSDQYKIYQESLNNEK